MYYLMSDQGATKAHRSCFSSIPAAARVAAPKPRRTAEGSVKLVTESLVDFTLWRINPSERLCKLKMGNGAAFCMRRELR